VSSLDSGLKSLDVSMSSQCAAAVDNLAGYYFKNISGAMNEGGTPAAQVQHTPRAAGVHAFVSETSVMRFGPIWHAEWGVRSRHLGRYPDDASCASTSWPRGRLWARAERQAPACTDVHRGFFCSMQVLRGAEGRSMRVFHWNAPSACCGG
jgi:hypothetical protein